jgi:hypothetical protein
VVLAARVAQAVQPEDGLQPVLAVGPLHEELGRALRVELLGGADREQAQHAALLAHRVLDEELEHVRVVGLPVAQRRERAGQRDHVLGRQGARVLDAARRVGRRHEVGGGGLVLRPRGRRRQEDGGGQDEYGDGCARHGHVPHPTS